MSLRPQEDPTSPSQRKSVLNIHWRTDVEAEASILWSPDAKNQLTGKDADAGQDWGQVEKGTTEDKMVGWHHQLDRHESEQALGVSDGQGSLSFSCPWDHKESDMTEWLNWTEFTNVECWISAPSREGDFKGLVSWEETLPSAPTALFKQCPIWGTEPLLGHCSSRSLGWGWWENKQGRQKQGCVEILKKLYSLVFKLATPSKSSGFSVQGLRRSIVGTKALGSRPRGRERPGDVKSASLFSFSLCEPVCLSRQKKPYLPLL